jgi:dihydroorotate dehydrogenase electron transfer subunit
MAVIKSNYAVAEGIYLMEVAWEGTILPGQFFMVRAWDRDPLLSRPISVHDYADGVVTFLYQVKGRGTQILSQLDPMDAITLEGPFGNGFPQIGGNLVAVGGGIGIAPLLYAVRQFKAAHKHKRVRVYLGYSEESYRVEAFDAAADEVVVNVGGIITDNVTVKRGETVIACGPNMMMRALCGVVPEKFPVHLSLEERMACGMGVCLGCSIPTASGNRKVCHDGPVFERNEIIWEGMA